jgi:hypothetical protein
MLNSGTLFAHVGVNSHDGRSLAQAQSQLQFEVYVTDHNDAVKAGMVKTLVGWMWLVSLGQCFSNFVRPRPGKFFFYKTRARPQQIIGLQAIIMTGHKQRYSLSRMLKDFDV